jgi:hypothetical protein
VDTSETTENTESSGSMARCSRLEAEASRRPRSRRCGKVERGAAWL